MCWDSSYLHNIENMYDRCLRTNIYPLIYHAILPSLRISLKKIHKSVCVPPNLHNVRNMYSRCLKLSKPYENISTKRIVIVIQSALGQVLKAIYLSEFEEMNDKYFIKFLIHHVSFNVTFF